MVGILPRGAVTPMNAEVYTAMQPDRTGEGNGSNFEVINAAEAGRHMAGEAEAQLNSRARADWMVSGARATRAPASDFTCGRCRRGRARS